MTIQNRQRSNNPSRPGSARGDTSSTHRHSGRRSAAVKRSAPDRTKNPKVHFDRYIALAQSAEVKGEKVNSENYYQHAEHFFRLMNLDPTEE